MIPPARKPLAAALCLAAIATACGNTPPSAPPTPPPTENQTAETPPPTPPALTPEERAVVRRAEGFVRALVRLDVEETMSYVSEDFHMTEIPTKQALREYLARENALGMQDVTGINVAFARPTFNGDRASVYPIEIQAIHGDPTVIELLLEREAEDWMIIDFILSEGSAAETRP